jgi:hypothetical protein
MEQRCHMTAFRHRRRAFSLYLRAYWPGQQILDGTWAHQP